MIAPDLLGHGASDKPRGDYSIAAYANGMRDLLSVLDIEQATVVGHSLGGGIALQFAYQFPERCERLALVGSGGLGPELSAGLRAATLPGAELVLTALTGVSGPLRMGLQVLERVGHAAGWRRVRDLAEAGDALLALKDVEARRAFLRTLRGVVDARGQAVTALDRLYLADAVPMLVVWGSRDPIVPARHAETGPRAGAERPHRGVRGRRALAAPRRARPVLRRPAGLHRHDRARGARPGQLAAAALPGPREGAAPRSNVCPVEHWDVVVVGGGPAGAACAAAARRAAGRSVLVLDRADFPRDKVCGDGIAPEALDVLAGLGVDPPA